MVLIVYASVSNDEFYIKTVCRSNLLMSLDTQITIGR